MTVAGRILAAVTIMLGGLAAGAQEPEVWRGEIDLSAAGAPALEISVKFTGRGEDATALLSIPAQGLQDYPVQSVVYTADRIEFTLAASAAVFTADRQGDSADGALSQGGGQFPLHLERVADSSDAGPNRPQMPVAPFPYEAVDVTYDNPVEGHVLAGTLTVPAGSGPHPAALMITGSGSQDRDETIFGHKPFWVIADHLSRRGIAVLRVDDRGVGGSGGARADITTADYVTDVAAGVAFLRARADIDAARIGLIGHSEGGLIAPMVASADPELAFVVLMAAPGVNGREILDLQNQLLLAAAGLSPERIDERLVVQRKLWSAMGEGAEASVIDPLVEELLNLQLDQSGVTGDAREQAYEAAYAAARAQAMSPWFRHFINTEPAPFLEATGCPVLALNGSLDLQVDAAQNLPQIEAALRSGGNDDVTVMELDGLNHLLQHATTGSVAEYGTIEETISEDVLAIIAEWVEARVGS